MLEGRAPDIIRWRMHFDIDAVTPDEWVVHRRASSWTRGADQNRCNELFVRIASALGNGFFEELTEQKLLGHFCLRCGKGLRDPASMARRIGPECWLHHRCAYRSPSRPKREHCYEPRRKRGRCIMNDFTDEPLACPACGGACLHPDVITVFSREEDVRATQRSRG
jgi:hypothetical protein